MLDAKEKEDIKRILNWYVNHSLRFPEAVNESGIDRERAQQLLSAIMLHKTAKPKKQKREQDREL